MSRISFDFQDLTAPRQQRIELSFGELVRRFGADPPRIFVCDRLPAERVIWESFEAPDVPRLTAYAMSRETLHRARMRALHLWGPSYGESLGGAALTLTQTIHEGSGVEIPVMRSTSPLTDDHDPRAFVNPYRWRIELR